MLSHQGLALFEEIVIINRSNLVRLFVGLLDELCHWGLALKFQKSFCPRPSWPKDQDAAFSYCSDTYLHAPLPPADKGLNL